LLFSTTKSTRIVEKSFPSFYYSYNPFNSVAGIVINRPWYLGSVPYGKI
jgi:hypothetical protein